ncbi:hypothetical protein SUGI_0359360 [Cryptomeria japonica]|nr:hypothetical protein SUGI_0359360 [Cryptomeria japonica]
MILKFKFYVELKKCIEDLKGLLIHSEVSVAGVQYMGPEYSSLSSEMVDDSTHSRGDNVRGMFQLCAGLEKCIGGLKGLLFHSEVSVLVCNLWEVIIFVKIKEAVPLNKSRMCEYSSLYSEMIDDSLYSHQSHDDNASGKSQIYVGLNYIADLKRPWFHSKVLVVSMQCMPMNLKLKGFKGTFDPQRVANRWCHCMGAREKTTLALNLCKDPYIKEGHSVPNFLALITVKIRGTVPPCRRHEYSTISSKIMDDSMHPCDDNVLQKSQFYMGLEKCIGDLKGLWFQGQVSVVDVQGGLKTDSALNLYSDPQIKVYSHDDNVSENFMFGWTTVLEI